MSERITRVRLSAQIAEYEQGMLKAAAATRQVGTEAERLTQQREAFNQLGAAALGVGVAVTAITALSVKAAADWESAWTGVTKTVSGTPEQLAAVEEGLRGLTSVLPASHEEIAAVAEAAGQLGIQTDNVVDFTETMINLGETTNLSAEQAATALARFSNIMGTTQGEVDNLGSAIVGLGNNYATTEAEITEMALRLAGAGRQIGLTEGDVLGLSTALSSVGIEAEAGGTAFSKVMIDIAAAVDEGGDRVQQFASVAGVSADEFSRKWRTAPGEALALFVKGLANAESQGSSTLGVLAELGITEVRMRDALLRSAGAADLFAEAMSQGNDEFELNNALTEEAAKRYETVESRIAIAGNAVNDMAISFGEVLLPAVGAVADAVTEFAGFLGGLPAPVQGAITILAALVGVTALAGGTALLAVPKWVAFKTALESTKLSMRGLSIAGGAVGVALTALVTVVGAVAAAQQEARQRAESYADAIRQGADAVDELTLRELQLDKTLLWKNYGSALDAAETLGITYERVTEAIRGNEAAQEDIAQVIQRSKDAFNQWTQEGLDAYNAAVILEDALREQGDAYAEGGRKAEQAENATRDSTSATEDATDAYSDATDEVSGLNDELSDLIENLNEANGIGQDAITANLDYKDALAEVDEYVRKAKEGVDGYSLTLDDNTQAGRDNMDMLVGLAEDSQAAAEAQFALDGDTAKYHDTLKAGRDALIKRAMDLGYNADQAQKLADKIYAIPTKRDTEVTVHASNAIRAAEAVAYALSGIKDTYTARVVIQTAGLGSVTGQFQGGFWEQGVQAFASGGFPSGIYQGRQGGIHKFAESEMGVPWETYISGREADRDRNIGIWMETGRRLGVQSTPPTVDVAALAEAVAAALPRRVSIDGPVEIAPRSIDGLSRANKTQSRADLRTGVI